MALRRQRKGEDVLQIYGNQHDADLFKSSKDADYQNWKGVAPVRVKRHERLSSQVLIGGAGVERAEIMRPKNIALPEVAAEATEANKKYARRKAPRDTEGVSLGCDLLGTGSRFKTSYERQCEKTKIPSRPANAAAGMFRAQENTPGTSILSWNTNPHINSSPNPMRKSGQRAEALLQAAQLAQSTPPEALEGGFKRQTPPEAPTSNIFGVPQDEHVVPRKGKRRSIAPQN
eukprot:TRINITY_DN2742_c4_g1_i1.p1 TRINITY_DN2742_c4_g1~~TRINITY_DN2742_c4_g1_i1.p1  ORF type:complete len:239 (+),score=64.34 TRINITY_DN2742_c4_g1_i1:27-719(+)